MNLQTQLNGPATAVILWTLAGVALGAIGGCVYGYRLERAAITEEIRRIAAGRVNYRSADGLPISKVAAGIKSETRKTGLLVGIPIGTVAGLVIGCAAAIAICRRNPVSHPPAENPDAKSDSA